ncbi:MAG TPA: tetratricopeptide repeat protein [Bryobacteraceae bacterium]|jgi:tetratricopeptide (TPR) repeat protein|nr:tetratricopeptide repeat protein [Bryobacteraceae bacterium]
MRGFLFFLLTLAAPVGLLSARTPEWDRAHELYQRTEYVQALAILDRVPGKDADALQLIGQCHFMRGDYKQASEAFEKALALEPRSSELHRLMGTVYGRRAETGNIFTAAGNAKKAHEYFEEAVALDPNNREAVANLFEYYLEAPGVMGGGVDKAENLIKHIAKLNPAAAFHAQAQLESKRKRFDVAEAELRRALQAEPQNPGRLIDLARFLADHGRIKGSDEKFAEAARVAPNSPELLFARAETYIRQKRNLNDARQLLERYLASPLTPDDPPRDDARTLLTQTGN